MSARRPIFNALVAPFAGNLPMGHDEAKQLLDAYRAEVLREAAEVSAQWNSDCQSCAVELEVAGELRRMADEATTEKATPTGEATPDFFQPGRTYTEDAPFRAPEDRPNFQCIAVAVHPTTGDRRALGFEQPGAGRPWRSSSMRDEEWADGWTDITEGGDAR